MGRCKYLSPVYASLENSGQHDLGVQWYNENIDFYHPVALSTEARVLGIDTEGMDFHHPRPLPFRRDIVQ